MKTVYQRVYLSILCTICMVALTFGTASAGAPLTNAEGVGGCALNPFAYLANTSKDKAVGMPQLGMWNIGLTESDINWWTVGGNITLLNRVELGYSHEFVDIQGTQNVDKDNISLKINIIPENMGDMKFLPAISAGLIWKNTSFDALTLRHTGGMDYYIVATKMIGGLPVPLILNAGLLSTSGYVRGVLGFGSHRDIAFFCNIETIMFEKFIVGWEYEQDTDVGKVFKNSDTTYGTHSMWEAHVAYMHTNNLMLVGSVAYTGDKDNVSQASFGWGYVLSLQYAF